MLLVLDVGNTNATAGVFAGRRLVAKWRHETELSRAALTRELIARSGRLRKQITHAVIGSVVPPRDPAVRRAVQKAFGVAPVFVGPRSRLGMRLRVKTPSQVGADRVLNALAAHELFGAPAVVVDFGTATTFDVVSRSGDYLGGAILPGPRLAAQILHDKTAKLPLVPIARPRRVIGRDTVECIQAGLYFGYLGMIEKVLALTLAELRDAGEKKRPRLIATGGLAPLFLADLPRAVSAPDLTLDGLRIAHERLTS